MALGKFGPGVQCSSCHERFHYSFGLLEGGACLKCGGVVKVYEQLYHPPKVKRPIYVDKAIDLEDIKRINALPGLKAKGTCAGHLASIHRERYDEPSPWMEFAAPIKRMPEWIVELMDAGVPGDILTPATDFEGWHLTILALGVNSFWFKLSPARIMFGDLKAAARWWSHSVKLLRIVAARMERR